MKSSAHMCISTPIGASLAFLFLRCSSGAPDDVVICCAIRTPLTKAKRGGMLILRASDSYLRQPLLGIRSVCIRLSPIFLRFPVMSLAFLSWLLRGTISTRGNRGEEEQAIVNFALEHFFRCYLLLRTKRRVSGGPPWGSLRGIAQQNKNRSQSN